jgi:hypothetical protein
MPFSDDCVSILFDPATLSMIAAPNGTPKQR